MRTLLVEDDPTSRHFLQEILIGLGYEVDAFSSAESGWQAYKDHPFPLVVLDWRMPEGEMDGLDLCRAIRKHPGGANALVIVVTVRTGRGDLQAVLDAGADDYIPKPVAPEDLKVRLRIAQSRLEDVAARSAAEYRLDSVIANAPLILFTLDRGGIFTFAQGRGLAALRLTPEELVGQSVFDIARGNPDLPAHVNRAIGGEVFTAEVDIAGVTLDSWFAPLPEELGTMIVATDVSRRKQIEQELREEEERFRRFVEAAFEGIVLVAARRVMDCNSQAAKMFGYTVAEAVGKRVTDFLHPRDRSRSIQFLRERRSDPFELTGVRRDGTTVQIEIRMRPMAYHGREILVAAIQDVTSKRRSDDEYHKLEEQIRQAQKIESLGVLAGGIAHDFNNLLMGVLGNASLALMDLPTDSPTTRHIHQIESAAQRAADLTNQMLAFSGKGKFVVTRINLTDLVNEMSTLFETMVTKKIRLQYRLDSDLPEISGDPSQMKQILLNLITNATDAAGDSSGIIRIRTGVRTVTEEAHGSSHVAGNLTAGTQVYVEVRDAGCGMDEPTLARVFDPFFTTKFTGRGLGMAAVLGIVRGHSGAIRIASQPGQGTTVAVMFPPAVLSGLQPTQPRPAPDPGADHDRPTVLVVDDEHTVLTVTSQMLQRSGYSVVTAENGRRALELFEAHAAEVGAVLLDLTMPDLNGDQVFAKMRVIDPNARVILMSGYSEQEATNQFRGEGLVGFLQKPFTPATLNECVDGAVRGRAS